MKFASMTSLLIAQALALAGATLLSGSGHSARTAPEARWKAFQQAEQMRASSDATALPWRSIGPAKQGGRVVDIEFDPQDPYTFYVAYASGGLWKTSNNGQSFMPLSDQLPTTISGDLAIDPNQPSVLWLGTGEPNASRSSYSGLGMFKSTDAGKSFVSKGLLGSDRISKVLIDPTNSQRILVAVLGPLYTDSTQRGVYVTEDGGETWQRALGTDNATTGAVDLLFHPSDPNIVYAATWDHHRRPHDFRESGVGSAVYRSRDAGKSFEKLSTFPNGKGIGRIALAVTPAEPNWLYASIDHQDPLAEDQRDLGDGPLTPARLKDMSKAEFLRVNPEDVELMLRGLDFPVSLDAEALRKQVETDQLSMDELRGKLKDGNSSLFNSEIRGLELYKSENMGDSFAKTHTQPIRNVTYTYGYYFGKLEVAPDNAKQITLLGVPVVVSDDGGKTFSGRSNHRSVHVDHHVWAIDPKNPNRILNGNDGGVDVSYDRGLNFTSLDRGAHGQSYSLNFDLQTPYNVYTGMQDNGTWRGSSKSKPDDLEAWEFISGGDGMQTQIDPRDQSTYTGYQFGNYQYSGGHSVRPKAALNEPLYRFNWQTPILLSTHSPDVFYMAGNKVFRSLDKGKTFEAISGDLTRSQARGDVPFATITSLAESELQFGLLWAGTDDGELWVSNDGGSQWRDLGKKLPSGWVATVEPSRQARFRAYVALNRYRDDEQTALLYVTEDLGKSFRDISRGLPQVPINVVREDPINPDVLYVGTDRGVFVSLDRGKAWQTIGQGLPNVPVHDLRIHPRERELMAGTHGRSVWILDVLPIQELAAARSAKTLHAFYVDEFAFDRRMRGKLDGWFDHLSDAPNMQFNFYAAKSGLVELHILDKEKNLLQTLKTNAKVGLNQLRWNLLVDRQLALEVEKQSFEKAQASEKAADKKATEAQSLASKPVLGEDSQYPYHQAERFGWSYYLQPGNYRLQLTQGEQKAGVDFKVNAPKPIPSRKPAADPVRGKHQPQVAQGAVAK